MPTDVRVCFLGDSLTAGVGDVGQRGWVGRLVEGSTPGDVELTHYNLGVRTDTSSEVLARWHAEVAARRAPKAACALVVSFGVNDARDRFVDTHPVSLASANLAALLDGAAEESLPVLAVGLVPVADAGHNARSVDYDRAFQEVCRTRGVPFIEVFEAMVHTEAWTREVASGDGLHPSAGGYQALADLIGPRWADWLETVAAHRHRHRGGRP